jgi:hypothetical protein
MMSTLQIFWKYSWRSILVALGYMAGLILAGIIGAILGVQLSTAAARESSFILLFITGMLLGVFLGPFASRLALARGQHFILWGSLILFNIGSVTIEGAYFAPSLVFIPIPMLVVQQLLATVGAAFIITKVFASSGQSVSWSSALLTRPWYSWIWRFIASAMSYLLFYFVFGGLNYQLVTKPYYESHAGGLTVPAPEVVFFIESIRSLIIVFSIFLFLLSVRGTRRQLMVSTGWLLFAIGGIIPLVWQIGTLPFFLLVASIMEIFFQNFLTGAVAARLMGIEAAN